MLRLFPTAEFSERIFLAGLVFCLRGLNWRVFRLVRQQEIVRARFLTNRFRFFLSQGRVCDVPGLFDGFSFGGCRMDRVGRFIVKVRQAGHEIVFGAVRFDRLWLIRFRFSRLLNGIEGFGCDGG